MRTVIQNLVGLAVVIQRLIPNTLNLESFDSVEQEFTGFLSEKKDY